MLWVGGIIFACAPFMGIGGAEDPLELGEFMKKMKWGIEGRPYLDKWTIRKAFEEAFDYVDVANMSFLGVFIAGRKPIRVPAEHLTV